MQCKVVSSFLSVKIPLSLTSCFINTNAYRVLVNSLHHGVIYFYSCRAGELLGHVKDSWMLVFIFFFVMQNKIILRGFLYISFLLLKLGVVHLYHGSLLECF